MVVLCMIQAVSPLSYQEALELSCCAHVCFLESLNLSYICNQVVTTSLPFSTSLDDCSHGCIMSSYMSFAHV